MFLRHKLQKGLLTRDQEPKEEEMKLMSDYITKLEGFPDLEVSIIRATKINKVLKAILKLENIPKEADFNFKNRSQALLDKWNKLLATEAAPPAATNGVNGTSAKADPATPNGVDKVKEAAKATKADAKVDDEATTSEKSEKGEKKAAAVEKADKADKSEAEVCPTCSLALTLALAQ